MANLHVLCARSMHAIIGALANRFTNTTGHAVDFDFDTVGGLQKKLDAGARADVLILSEPMIEALENAGRLVAGSRRGIACTYVAVCVKAGAPLPPIATPEEFERTLRDAPAIAFSAAGVGGSAGVHLEKLFTARGLAPMIATKGLPQQSGAEVARRVAEGKASIGLTLSGEIASVPGVVIAGPLPAPLGSETRYVAAVSAECTAPDAARELLDALTAPRTRDEWTNAGFDPP